MRHRGSVRWQQNARLQHAIECRCIMCLEDEPGDLAVRRCHVRGCGAPVKSYVLKPASESGPGGEVIYCERGHRLHPGDWNVRPAD